MNQSPLVTEGTVGTDQNLLGYGLSEDLHLQRVCQDFLCFLQKQKTRQVGLSVVFRTLVVFTATYFFFFLTFFVCLFTHSVQVWMDQCYVVVAGDDVS